MQPEFSPGDMDYLREHLLAWGKANFADFPWRHVTNRWHALAAEMMMDVGAGGADRLRDVAEAEALVAAQDIEILGRRADARARRRCGLKLVR